MRAAELHQFLARHTGYSVREIDERTRWLHQGGFIPPGRGRSAPHLLSGHASRVILSLAARRAVDAETVGRRAASLGVVPRPGTRSQFDDMTPNHGPTAFFVALANLIITDGSIDHFDVAGVEISEDGGTAWLLFNSGARLLFTDNKAVARRVKKDLALYDTHRQDGIDRRLYIGAGFLKDLAIRLGDRIKAEKLAE